MTQELNKGIDMGNRFNNYIEKFVPLDKQYDAKFELNEILQELLIKIYK